MLSAPDQFPVRVRHLAPWLLAAIVAACPLLVGSAAVRAAEDKGAKSAAAKDVAAKDVEESWEVIYSGTSRIGFTHTTSQTLERGGQKVIVTDAEATMNISRFGQSVKTRTITRTVENEAGDLLEYNHEVQNPPAASTLIHGRVADGKLVVETEVSGKTSTKESDWDKSVKSPAFQSRLLREKPLKPKDKRTMKIFDPSLGAVTTVTYQVKDYEMVKLLDGKESRLLSVNVLTSAIPGLVVQEYLDEDGESRKTSMSLLQLTTYKVSKEEALKNVTGGEIDLAVGTLVKVDAIKNPRQTRRVTYRISTIAENPENLLAEGSTQQLKPVDAHTVDLVVQAVVPPATKGDATPADKSYLAPNPMLQSDDERVQKHAEAAVGKETDPWKSCQLMEHWVFENLKAKNFSTLLASAGEVAKKLEGDCTEHAVLLAAMARARGIPSRVAIGLVYIDQPSSFGGHMWTEVYINGAWIPLDATLGKGHVAAEHIKFADSSLVDANPGVIPEFLPMVTSIGNMQIKVVKVE